MRQPNTGCLFLYIRNLLFTDKVCKMAFGMASNLFHLNHNFLTHKCLSLSEKRHLFKHTEIYGSSEMIAYAPQDILRTLSVSICGAGYFAGVFVNPQILLGRSSQQSWCPPFSGANAALREYLLLHFSAEITKLSFGVVIAYAPEGYFSDLACSCIVGPLYHSSSKR